MKSNYSTGSSGTMPKTGFQPFSEKTLLIFFAGLSLAFALFYTFAQDTAQASSGDSAVSQAMPRSVEPVVINKSLDSSDAPDTVANIVAKALAFKASLTTAQQATLEKTYTTTLARKWSNLPCGANCRNGIQFSTLTATQLALALEVIQAAAGTTANEGSDEFNQIRLADAYLGANGGGGGYSSGIYFIAFLNTPTTTGGWMLQFGGHHYGANIAYNGGHVVGTTPTFEGVEPLTFTVSGVTYSPLLQERAALANMLASLTTAQLTTARLTQTFGDVTLAPGESNGGSSAFPATKVGLAVSTLSDAQKLLVLEAMKPWVKDADDTVATNLLTIYQNELNGTYIAYTGNGTSGNAASFLNANTNYARIDGVSGWIEFVCQNGVVLSGIHYHSVYRDRVRDYGADLSLTTPLDTTTSRTPFDFDGDGKADVSVFRPSTGIWYLNQSTSGFASVTFGQTGDVITPADYDGDGKTDVAVYRGGTWYIQRSTTGFTGLTFGASDDIPAPADFDGDGKAELAVFRPSTGAWYLYNPATSSTSSVAFGQNGDVPAIEDYDGDNKADIAVFRAGTWYIQQSTAGFTGVTFGASTDTPVPADYDGDGKADVAVFRSGTWYLQQSTAGFTGVAFGLGTDLPVPADYDGDGKADIAVFRDGTWYLNRSTAGFTGVAFGASTDLPIPNAFIQIR